MTSKKMDSGSKDFITSLPEVLIGHILSFLTTRDAALTSVLSKRWRYLLAFVPNLDLDNTFYDQPEMSRQRKQYLRQSFKLFVDRVMALQGNDAPLNKFSLKYEIGSQTSQVNGWVLKALERGVVELDLYVSSEYKYPLPRKVFMSKTLVTLKVAGSEEFTIDVGEVFLPKLKTLHFSDVVFKDESGAAFAKLISCCHALEELVMVKVMWGFWDSCIVSNPTLKRVTICAENIDDNPMSVSFDTPNLVYLEFDDTVAAKYPEANFKSLVEASIGLRMTPAQVFRSRDLVNRHYGYTLRKKGNAADFLKGISNVKILYLLCETLEVLTFCCKAEAIPVFNNLVHLTIETDQDVEWESLPNLLKNCPNLETIVFEGLNYGDTNQCSFEGYRFKDTNRCFELPGRDRCECKPWDGVPTWLSSCPVKTLKVLEFGEFIGRSDDFHRQVDLIKHFVETMPNLEQVILYWDTPFDDDLGIQLSKFQLLEKVASLKCKIQIVSDNISLSTTLYSSSSTNEPVFFKTDFRSEDPCVRL